MMLPRHCETDEVGQNNLMKLSLFDYAYPRQQVAQHPAQKRDEAKLLVLNRKGPSTSHRIFKDILTYLNPGDCLVLNNTKVLPTRFAGKKKPTGGHVVAILSNKLGHKRWEALIHANRIRPGTQIRFGSGKLEATVLKRMTGNGTWLLEFSKDLPQSFEKLGKVPLPPYMKREPQSQDKKRYQTVYAEHPGSIAAPTAGLHFSQPLLKKIQKRGVYVTSVTCHIGYATFRLVEAEDIREHKMHEEAYQITQESIALIRKTKKESGRIIAVGTSSVRVLETLGERLVKGPIQNLNGSTQLFIKPPFHFKVVDALLTNFHMPRTTLMILVSAFAGRDPIMRAYKQAIKEGYRLFSYGDAMLII
jgi:S-adenosylmethionine:tRNA ribosyltransferase-isomerase